MQEIKHNIKLAKLICIIITPVFFYLEIMRKITLSVLVTREFFKNQTQLLSR